MHHRTRIATRFVTAIALAACAPAALAQQADDTYWVHVTAYWPRIESSARSDLLTNNRPGTEIRFEDELGLPGRRTLPVFQAGMRLGEQWRLELEYFSLRRNGERSSSREITWGDTVYPVAASLRSSFDSDILRVSAGWSYQTGGATEFGAVFGLHVTRFRIGLEGAASVGDQVSTGRAEAEEALVPLPTLGVYLRHDLGRAWSISGRVDLFSFRFDKYDGGLINATVAAVYRISDRVGLSVGYRSVDYSLEMSRPNWRGGVDYHFRGPFLGLQAGF
jgi:hypothetical protein